MGYGGEGSWPLAGMPQSGFLGIPSRFEKTAHTREFECLGVFRNSRAIKSLTWDDSLYILPKPSDLVRFCKKQDFFKKPCSVQSSVFGFRKRPVFTLKTEN